MKEDQKGDQQGPPIMMRIYYKYPTETLDSAFDKYIKIISMIDNKTNVFRVFEIADYMKKDKLQMHRDVFADRPNILVGGGAIYCKS